MALPRADRPQYDYSELLNQIRIKGYTRKTLAKEIGKSYPQFCHNLRNHYPLTQDDILCISSVLGIPSGKIGRVFFTEEVGETKPTTQLTPTNAK